VTEGTVTRWLKKEGEHVTADEPLLAVSTDKVDSEILRGTTQRMSRPRQVIAKRMRGHPRSGLHSVAAPLLRLHHQQARRRRRTAQAGQCGRLRIRGRPRARTRRQPAPPARRSEVRRGPASLTIEQILDMVGAIAQIPGDARYREPILQAVLDALRPVKHH
jgi:hypothetical protein